MWQVALGAAALAGAADYFSARDANNTNKDIARDQMYFQERMSNTAHQREVEDLRKAGLNPILSSKYGGASTPPGASATMVAPRISDAVSSARQSMIAHQELQNLKETNTAIKTQQSLNSALTVKAYNDGTLSRTNAALNALQIPKAANRAKMEESSQGKTLTAIDRYLDTIGKGASSVGDVVNPFKFKMQTPSPKYYNIYN